MTTTFKHPGSWSIATKLATAFVLTALLPMVVAGWYNLTGSLATVAKTESANLEQLASATAGRIDQFIGDTRHLVSYFVWSEEAIRVASDPSEPHRVRAHDKMNRLLSSNEDIELLMVLDRQGHVVASTKPEYINRNLAFREYFKDAVAGRQYLSSHMDVGTVTKKAGLYLSGAVRSPSGTVAGVAVIKMKGDAIAGIVEEVRRGSERIAFVIDTDGVVIQHPDERVRYHSLKPLAPEVKKRIVDEKRFGIATIDSLNLPGLADRMLSARVPGHAEYRSPLDGQPAIAGFAPLQTHTWVVAVTESKASFSRPLVSLYDKAVYSVIIVGLVFSGIALLFARIFLQPIRELTRSAEALRLGNYAEARAPVHSQDELGQLAATFNTMIDGVVARERERDIFGRVVSPEVREKLLAGELALGGENRRVTVLFSDIRGFTTLSEKMSPQDVVAMLNEYLTEMTTAIKPWGGYINNFIGDAIVVIFGAPVGRAETEWCAVASAFAMRDALAQINRRRAELGDAPLESGIGISTGKVVVGQVGSLDRFLYTVIGDAVNVASRLEGLTKDFDDNPILCNAATFEAIRHREDMHAEDRGTHHLKGRSEAVHVFSVAPATPGGTRNAPP